MLYLQTIPVIIQTYFCKKKKLRHLLSYKPLNSDKFILFCLFFAETIEADQQKNNKF